VLAELVYEQDPRVLASPEGGEDAAVLSFPREMALVQSLDFFTPIVNDPYSFGQVAAANSLSDIYAMGGDPYSVMNIVCFPSKTMSLDILKEILRGGLDKIREAGAIMSGGHSVEDAEIKYGLSVTGYVDPKRLALNRGANIGEQLVLTKPLGTGILATAVKAGWSGAEKMEQELLDWAGRLNMFGARVIQQLGLSGATDVTGFGLGGHALEMARASRVRLELWSRSIPLLPTALELAGMGLIPEGSYANKHYCEALVSVDRAVDPVHLDLVFDAQTSGGLLLSVPEEKLEEAVELLEGSGDLAAHIGRVLPQGSAGPGLNVI
jgi:selenide,water dikinase